MTLCKKITEQLEKRENNYMNEMYNGDISDKKLIWKAFTQGMIESFADCCLIAGAVFFAASGAATLKRGFKKEDKQ